MSQKIARTEPFSLEIPDYITQMDFAKIETHFVAILGHQSLDRRMIASPHHTRCIQDGEIHELVYVAESPDGLIDLNDAWYLGFIKFPQGGVLAKGMTIEINGQGKGKLIGFDETHFPNHLNLLISDQNPQNGQDMSLKLNDSCDFVYNRS
jgi:hypothetical protein